MKLANLITGAFFFLLSLFFIYESGKLPAEVPGSGLGPGVLPYCLAVCLGTLSGMLFLLNVFSKSDSEQFLFNRQELTGVGLIFTSLSIYVFSMEYLGFAIATVVFITFLTNMLGKYSWWKCVFFGAAVSAICIQVFKNFLAMPLPMGVLGI